MNTKTSSSFPSGFTADMPAAAVRKLVDTFVTRQPAEISSMRQDLDAGNMEDFRRRAHSLKGAARLLGAERLGDLAAGLEAAAEQDGATTLGQDIDTASAELERVIAALRTLSEGLKAAA